jgi:hypothetical protein
MSIRKKQTLLIAFLLITLTAFTQDTGDRDAKKNHLSSQAGETTFGLGLGLPYGALGVRLGTNITNGLNLFGGVGYQIAGVGYNIGLLKDFPSSGMTQFYLTGMYGTNAAIKVVGLSDYNKVYTGPTFGLGIKINSRKTEGNYWDVGLLVPIRSDNYEEDERAVRIDPRISKFQGPFPLLIVVGYNFNL